MLDEDMRIFSVGFCPSSLWCPKWWRRFGDLFDFLGYLPQGIVGGFCRSEALQESLYAVFFLVLRSCLNSCVALFISLLLYLKPAVFNLSILSLWTLGSYGCGLGSVLSDF
jgi:hypothetical protein